jgi:LysM repeat protein
LKCLTLFKGVDNVAQEYQDYIVQKGDNLTKIAKQYGTTWSELANINQIANPNLIIAGQTLKIPVAQQTQQPTQPSPQPIPQPQNATTNPSLQQPNVITPQQQTGYVNPYQSLLDQITKQIMGMQEFKYDPTTDTALKQAQEQASRAVMEQMAARGILNSTITSDRVAQYIQDLIPQYEQMAYERQDRAFNRTLQTAQYIMSLSDDEYRKYRDNLDYQFQLEQFEYAKQQDAIQNRMKEIDQAWDRVNNLGYVDNEASKILGVPAGTKSWEARRLAEQQKFELEMLQKQNERAMMDKIQDYLIVNNIGGLREGMSLQELTNLYNQAAPQIQAQQQQQQQAKLQEAIMKQAQNIRDYIDKFLVYKDEEGRYQRDKMGIVQYLISLRDSGLPDELIDQLFMEYGITDTDLKLIIGNELEGYGQLSPSERGRILKERGYTK